MPIKTTTREQYAKRLDKVALYLADHLDDTLDIHRLAEEAHLSPYHFHRVYVAMVGETVAETAKRLRLQRAALKLITTASPVAKLAGEAGYASVQAFHRAFRAAHGIPPGAFRKRGEELDLAAGIARGLHPSQRKPEPDMYQVTIQDVPARHVAAMEYRGDYTQIGPTFERLSIWAAGKGLMGPDTRMFGIYYDDPASMPTAQLRADACVTVPEGFKGEGAVKVEETPSGKCAVIVHTGPYSELHRAYDWLYREWLPKSGEAPGDQPCFEEYLNDPRQVPPSKLETAIRIPLK
ncbi:DNA gyrase inhibitor [Usitatibacter rugosus]|uniref:DNA gyrase inhibitor n=1 Tax=Usitatibacter rugosus TaxID=2732067 RepID=A0A6M4GVY0_9PROT|nr:AraC family transcriptional regulator [Usitatibacter rugosus]QJR09797.1 DNA gyrase inhibitor [Usitatibacter rugosus]